MTGHAAVDIGGERRPNGRARPALVGSSSDGNGSGVARSSSGGNGSSRVGGSSPIRNKRTLFSEMNF
jgi:hypothetical protein